jgi:hypothetical protein
VTFRVDDRLKELEERRKQQADKEAEGEKGAAEQEEEDGPDGEMKEQEAEATGLAVVKVREGHITI